MALQKQSININFGQGLDTKTDEKQIPLGKFLSLTNSVFTKGGLLTKRNGFPSLNSLPDASSTYLTTFNGNLTAIGNKLEAYSTGSTQWFNKGSIQPLQLSVQAIVRNSLNQTQCDSALASNGLVCTVYTQTDIVSGSATTNYYYAIDDSTTGQNIVPATILSTPQESPRVFILQNYFVVLYSQSSDLNYIAIPIQNPAVPLSPTTLVTNYSAGGTGLAFDGAIFNNQLFISYNGSDGGGAIRGTYLNSFLVRQTSGTGAVLVTGKSATMMSVSADNTNSIIYSFFYKTSGTVGYVVASDASLTVLTAFSGGVSVISSDTILNVTSAAQNGVLTIFYEVSNNYTYDSSVPTHFITKNTVTQAASVGTATTLLRSVGLASKAFILNSTIYVLTAYSSPYQPTYFLTDSLGNIVSKLAYQNGGGYLALGLPAVNVNGLVASIPYLFKDFIQATNKSTNLPTGSQVAGIYSQTGINLASFTISSTGLSTAEIGNNLNLTGGFLWMYDGYQPVEQNFFVYPDSDPGINGNGTSNSLTVSNSGGTMTTQTYYYQFIYQWSDQEGNIFRSAPSIPIQANTADFSSSSNSVTINVPNLRLTYKSNVQIYIYRWSVANQTYYQLPTATLIAGTVGADSTSFVDITNDTALIGNALIYTTGNVVEDIGPPAFNAISLFKSRLFGISSEDGSIWYSKQVIQGTPVEMSDLFTLYLAPTIGAQGSTGVTACLFPMDDKIIFFKKNAGIYYLTGDGPDNTGANSDYGDFVFITSTLGCSNQASIVFIPQGLMFQDGTGKGLWLLGRDLSTTYIGAAVEKYNAQTVTSAFAIPGTNQVRFTLNNGMMLVYDYYYQQWSTFSNINLNAISSCLYQEAHTFINQYGQVFQEASGTYLDGTSPVLMSFTTGWISLAGLQGYQRIYDLYLLGEYFSPHKLAISLAYDYSPAATQQSIISPNNFNPNYGNDASYGSLSAYGGVSQLEQWRIHTERQTCEAFQMTLNEVFDSSYGVQAGVGLTLSNINLRLGLKKSVRPIRAANSVG